MSNRIVTRYASLLLAAFVIGACQEDEPTGVNILPFDVTPIAVAILEGQTTQLKLTGVAGSEVDWESTVATVATVSSTGLVTAVAGGITAVSAYLRSDRTQISSATVEVIAVPVLTSGVARTGLSGSGRGAKAYYKIQVPAGKTSLTVSLGGGTGDADMYIRFNALPTGGTTNTATSCASEAGGNTETCVFTNPPAGTWFILIQVWDNYTGASLTGTIAP